MKIKTTLTALLVIVLSLAAIAQKNRPVAGDAITLFEILRTDYSLIDDQEQRLVRISADKKRIISILKAYAAVAYPRDIPKFIASNDSIATAKEKVTADQQVLQRIVAQGPTGNSTAAVNLANYNASVKTSTTTYIASLTKLNQNEHYLFLSELTALEIVFAGNPYLKALVADYKTKFQEILKGKPDSRSNGFSGTGALQLKSGPLIGTGALSFTEAMDGLTRFIIKRLKEELATQVFDKLSTELSKQEYEDFRVLLPKTMTFLTKIPAEQIPRLFHTLKETFYEDLADLTDNFPTLVAKSPTLSSYVTTHPEYQFLFEGLGMIQQMSKVENPLEVIAILENASYVQTWAADVSKPDLHNTANSMKLASLFVQSILVREYGTTSILGLNSWKSHAIDIGFYNTYLGLLFQQDDLYYDIQFRINGNTVLLKDILTTFYASLTRASNGFTMLNNRFGKPLENLLYQAESMSNQLAEMRKLKRDGVRIGADTLVSVLNTSINVIESAGIFADSILQITNGPAVGKFSNDFKTLIGYSRKAVSVYQNILDKAYTQAVFEAWTTVVNIPGVVQDPKVVENVTRVTDFLVSTLKAEGPEDFEKAIEAFALPPGSSSIKRKSKFNVAINTFPGLFLSAEKLINKASNKQDTLWGFNAALTVPVGISVAWGTGKTFRSDRDGALIIYASVIDLGAITSFRFRDEETELPEFSFKNIFAPGLFIGYGFPKTPFTIMLGGQYGPLIREVETTQNNETVYKQYSSFRLGATLTFDLPIFNLYTRAD